MNDETIQAIWTWDWEGGGYNYCKAATLTDAIRFARNYGLGALIPIESTFRVITREQIEALEIKK